MLIPGGYVVYGLRFMVSCCSKGVIGRCILEIGWRNGNTDDTDGMDEQDTSEAGRGFFVRPGLHSGSERARKKWDSVEEFFCTFCAVEKWNSN